MSTGFIKREPARTAFVMLDTKKCEACWKCITVCSKNVIGRINLPWHKHVRFVNKTACVGCMKCVTICASNAISKVIIKKGDC